MRYLTALPVFNEADHLDAVLAQIAPHAQDLLVVDDGSTDGTAEIVSARSDIRRASHAVNRGYGAALRTAFAEAIRHEYDVLVTIDADGQHDPQLIGQFVAACEHAEIVSGSRYLATFEQNSSAPVDRREINELITRQLNQELGLNITDAFCGFKAYRVQSLGRLHLTEDGYAMPLELWVQASQAGLRIRELAVPRIYLDPSRMFGGSLNDPTQRLAHYRQVIERSLRRASQRPAIWPCDELAWLAESSAPCE